MQKSKLDKFIQKYNLGGNVNSVKWKASGDSISTSFVTPDKSLLGSVKVDKTKIKLDRSFIDTFIKGKGALSGVDTFTVVKTDEGCQVVIGYSSTNTNRVNIPTESESCDIDTPVTFNANLFKEVLVANRECSSAILEVSTEGLARVNFKIDDYDSTYYIVAMQDVD
jgi:hypothetical protein